MKNLKNFDEFLNEKKNESVTFTIDDGSLDDKFLNDESLSKNLDYKKDKGDTYYTLPQGDFDRLIDFADSSGYDTDEIIYVIEGKIEINDTIKASNKRYTFVYQTGKAAPKTAKEINKELNDAGIKSFILKDFGDVVGIPTKDLQKAIDDVLSTYDNIKQFGMS